MTSRIVKVAILGAVLFAFSISMEAQNMAAPVGWFSPLISLYFTDRGGSCDEVQNQGGDVHC